MAVRLPGFVSSLELSDFGKGPAGASLPHYTSTVITPTVSNLQDILDAGEANNMTLFLNFAGSRNQWTDLNAAGKKIFNWGKYEDRVRRFEGIDTLTAAIASRLVINFTIDEPEIPEFDGSIPKTVQNDIGLLHKNIWPGCLTFQRSADTTLNPAPASYVSRVTGVATGGGYTGIDYGAAQWNRSANNSGLSKRAWFNQRRAGLLALNLGMVPGHNWINGGDGRLWDYQNTGTSSGRIQGDDGNNFWLASPDEIREVADGIYDDADAPGFFGYSHVDADFLPGFLQYQNRQDFIDAWVYMLNKFATRPTFNGYRTAKGDTTPPPPGGSVFRGATDKLGTRRGARRGN